VNVFAAFLWKEWRSQRALLAGYLALVWLSLALVLGILGTTNGVGSDAFTGTHFWCLATGLVGILGFAAPQTVRGELGGKDDQFLRRLPGALAPAFWSKAVFLVTATAAVVALACIIAWLLQIVLGVETPRLLGREFALLQGFLWAPLLLVPWVLAVAYWMPRGRMALGATVLLALLLGVAVWSLLRISPRLAETLSYSSLLWLCTPLALFVGCVSCACGRRGGGPARSARLGGAAMVVGLLPHGVWFGAQFTAYHWPDAERHGCSQVYGCTPDGRFALARVSADPRWRSAPFRIDLATGAAQQVGDFELDVELNVGRDRFEAHPHIARHWFLHDGRGRCELLDAATGTRQLVTPDADMRQVFLPTGLIATVAAERRLQLDLPDGRRAWIEGDQVCWQRLDGTVGRRSQRAGTCAPAGHGVVFRAEHCTGFDFVHEREVRLGETYLPHACFPKQWALRGCWLVDGGYGWRRIDGATDRVLPCCLSQRVSMLTAISDDEVLVTAKEFSGSGLATYRIADDRLTPLVLPATDERVDLSHMWRYERDPRGRIWFDFLADGRTHRHRVLDVRTQTISLVRSDECSLELIAFVGDAALMLEGCRRIVRFDLATNARTVLFPRSDATEADR
jgi:hypothetical protein